VGIASLEVILEEHLVEKSRDLGAWLLEELRKLNSPRVKEVRGKGLMIGVEIRTESGTARPYCERLKEEGILAKETHGQVIRLAPPLVITREDLAWALSKIAKVLA
jgi:ornithine--oxo-acid transaminase